MNIWILNHYATNMFFDESGRHQAFAKYLIKSGHKATIFCSNTLHTSEDVIDTGNKSYVTKTGADDVEYVFVKTTPYHDNGKQRIKNMIEFYFNVQKVMEAYMETTEKPDIILASSVHPLTLVAGERFAKKAGCPCVCEVRDLWPQVMVDMGMFSGNSLIAKVLYAGEKWIYKKADQLVFTQEGCKDYIKDRGWENVIDLDKVNYINNGVDLDLFIENKTAYKIDDEDLNDDSSYKIVYAGAIRRVNRIDRLVDLAAYLKDNGHSDIKMIIYGDGDRREELEKRCEAENLDNIVFKGRVPKYYIPYILSKADLNIVTVEISDIGHYGTSWNKLFEYFASEKPVVADYDMGAYNLIENHNFGTARVFETVEELGEEVLKYKADTELDLRGNEAAKLYDHKYLTARLLEIFDKCFK